MAEDQDFEVVDKRRVNADARPEEESEQPGAETTAEHGTTQETTESEAGSTAAGGPGAMPPITAGELVMIYINQLQEIAWSRMGLTPNPTSGTMDRDLADARLAIDCTADLIGRLDPHLDATTRRDLQTMLANLRMNFVQQNTKG